MSTCNRCGRELDPWPLKRSDVCSPPSWAKCIRQDARMERLISDAAEAVETIDADELERFAAERARRS